MQRSAVALNRPTKLSASAAGTVNRLTRVRLMASPPHVDSRRPSLKVQSIEQAPLNRRDVFLKAASLDHQLAAVAQPDLQRVDVADAVHGVDVVEDLDD